MPAAMRLFQTGELRAAELHATAGGQSLHMMHRGRRQYYRGTPQCFQKIKQFAHLIDRDEARLTHTAHDLGVRPVVVSRRAHSLQHVGLHGEPLERAMRMATITR